MQKRILAVACLACVAAFGCTTEAENNGGTNNGGTNNGGTNNGATNNGATNNGATNNGGTNNGGTNNGATNNAWTGYPIADCIDFPTNPEEPWVLDGLFGPDSEFWARPHDEEPVCPASAVTPADKAQVPFLAYAFCNSDSVEHTYSFELISESGPNGETALDDPYLLLYSGQGVPADPLQCLAVNDDIPDAIDAKDSEILDVVVPPGGAITAVPTAFTYSAAEDVGTGYHLLVISITDI